LDKVIFARLSGSGISTIRNLWESEAMLSERFDEWEAELRQEGRHKGREEGRQEGEAMLLARLLQKRFGELPASVHARLRSATQNQLEYWGEHLLDVVSLNELFNGDVTTLSESH
jgi:predicted transposase YdaD